MNDAEFLKQFEEETRRSKHRIHLVCQDIDYVFDGESEHAVDSICEYSGWYGADYITIENFLDILYESMEWARQEGYANGLADANA